MPICPSLEDFSFTQWTPEQVIRGFKGKFYLPLIKLAPTFVFFVLLSENTFYYKCRPVDKPSARK